MAEMTWADAAAQVSASRTKAETCVSLLKKFGDNGHIARGQLIYSDAKADSDAMQKCRQPLETAPIRFWWLVARRRASSLGVASVT